MRDTDMAYLAGVLDSDGYIRIHRSAKGSATYYSAQVGIAGTRTQPHELAQELFGGAVHCYQPRNPRHRAQYQWVAWSNDAVRVLTGVQPYLRVKVEQASLVLELQGLVRVQFEQIKTTTKPPYRIPSEMTAERERLFQRVTGLNQSRKAGHLLDGRTWDEFPTESPLSGRRRADAGTPAPAPPPASGRSGPSRRASATTTGQGTPA